MQIGFTIVMLILVLLFYLSNPKNKVNQWCAVAGFFFWFGIAKQAVMFEIIPVLHRSFGMSGLNERFIPVHSFCTWVIYTLAMPTMTIAGFYFGYIDRTHPALMRFLKPLMYVPAVVLLFFFMPLHFGEYQETSMPFWITFSTYNFTFATILTFCAARGSRFERRNTDGLQKNQRKQVALVMLPPLYYWLASIFLPRLFARTELFELWQAGLFITLVSIAIFIALALKDGFMGLRLVSQNYNWNTNTSLMGLINMNAEYASHFLKSQTSNMNMCVYLLKNHFASSSDNGEVSECLDILSASMTSLESYFDRVKLHSQVIQLKDVGLHRMEDLLSGAATIALHGMPGIAVHMEIGGNLFLLCDKIHMTEVFVNIFTNAAEAMGERGSIAITEKKLSRKYQLSIKDTGSGIDKEMLEDIFTPLTSTKSKDKNSGLGLSYCRNVIAEHNGDISAKSTNGAGTTILITFPSKRVYAEADGRKGSAAQMRGEREVQHG